ncbi:MAG: RNA polymerase subunit sigma-70 [Lachnospiraceae bacterium]|nr:RNA polymerase subunit sigma-70 [Lachnospiraceae bacterium]
MTAKEYLSQGYRLEQRIRLVREEIDNLQELAGSVSSTGFEEHYNATRNTEAPFIRTIYKIMELEDKQNSLLNQLLEFKQEMCEVIDSVDDLNERMVLYYRYIGNESWQDIGKRLFVDERTVRRWHNKALSHVVLPENPMVLEKKLLL